MFWQVSSSATLGTATQFQGNILALTRIALQAGANIQCGRALARNGALTPDTNTISICNGFDQDGTGPGAGGAIPEPGLLFLIRFGMTILTALKKGATTNNRHPKTVKAGKCPDEIRP